MEVATEIRRKEGCEGRVSEEEGCEFAALCGLGSRGNRRDSFSFGGGGGILELKNRGAGRGGGEFLSPDEVSQVLNTSRCT